MVVFACPTSRETLLICVEWELLCLTLQDGYCPGLMAWLIFVSVLVLLTFKRGLRVGFHSSLWATLKWPISLWPSQQPYQCLEVL